MYVINTLIVFKLLIFFLKIHQILIIILLHIHFSVVIHKNVNNNLAENITPFITDTNLLINIFYISGGERMYKENCYSKLRQ